MKKLLNTLFNSSTQNEIPLIKVSGIVDERKTSQGVKFWIKLTFRNNCDKIINLGDLDIKLVNKNLIPWLMNSSSNKIYKSIYTSIDSYDSNINVMPYSDKSVYIDLFTCNMRDAIEMKRALAKLQNKIAIEMQWQVKKYDSAFENLIEIKKLLFKSNLQNALGYQYEF